RPWHAALFSHAWRHSSTAVLCITKLRAARATWRPCSGPSRAGRRHFAQPAAATISTPMGANNVAQVTLANTEHTFHTKLPIHSFSQQLSHHFHPSPLPTFPHHGSHGLSFARGSTNGTARRTALRGDCPWQHSS